MRGRRPLVLALVLLVLEMGGGVGRSEVPPDGDTEEVRRARSFFEVGRARFRAGDYEGAARAFADGYEIVPRSTFLLNIGLCFRQLKQLDRAGDAFRRFLESAAADDPYRKQAREMLEEIARERAQPPPPPQPRPQPAISSPVVAPAPAPGAAPTSDADRRRRRRRTLAWALPLSGALATGLVVGLVLGLRARGPSCDDERFGCVDLR